MRKRDASGRLPRRRLGKMRKQQLLVTAVFLLVPLALLFTFTILPFFKMVEFSFFEMKYVGQRTYVGLGNYFDVFTRTEIFQALKLSLYYLGGAFIQLVLALTFATILSFKTRFAGLFKGIMFFPYLICGIAIGFIFKFFFTHGFVFDTVLGWFGFNLESLPYWLRDYPINNIALAATSVWRYMGQGMVLFIGAIMSIDPNLYEAADIDGANLWHKFWRIIMPGIRPIVTLSLILTISGSLSSFEQPYVITNGAFGTGTYFVVMNSMAHEKQKVGLAAAMAVVLLLIILLVTALQKMVFRIFINDDKNGYTFSERRAKKKRARLRQEHKGQKQGKGNIQGRAAG